MEFPILKKNKGTKEGKKNKKTTKQTVRKSKDNSAGPPRAPARSPPLPLKNELGFIGYFSMFLKWRSALPIWCSMRDGISNFDKKNSVATKRIFRLVQWAISISAIFAHFFQQAANGSGYACAAGGTAPAQKRRKIVCNIPK
jgi:hypothetical protein